MKLKLTEKKITSYSKWFELSTESEESGAVSVVTNSFSFIDAGMNYTGDVAYFDRAQLWVQENGKHILQTESVHEHLGGYSYSEGKTFVYENGSWEEKNASVPNRTPDDRISAG